MGIFAGSDTRQNRWISKRDPPGPKKVIKEILGLMERLQMAADLNMADNKIIHSATPCDADDAVNKSYVTNNLLKTDWTKPISADFNMSS